MILHVNNLQDENNPNGTIEKPFQNMRQAFNYICEHKLIDWRIRYYYEEITAWLFLH